MTAYEFDIKDYEAIPEIFPAEGYEFDGVEAFYFANEKYQGKDTRVFTYMGLPELKEGEKCPAMVLLHGGGGTTYREWIQLWNSRGYAAIMIDQCGCKPLVTTSLDIGPHEKHEHAGPDGWDSSFKQMDEPVEDHWPFHAVTAALRAHTILASHDQIDETRIGVTGISWGGYLTSLMMGIDSRYKAAIPIYGCGFLTDNSTWNDNGFSKVGEEAIQKWSDKWDPRHYIPNAKMPTLWVNSTNDFAYPMDSFQKSFLSAGGPVYRSIQIELPHGHIQGWRPNEMHNFTDSLFNDAPAFPVFKSVKIEDKQIVAVFESEQTIESANICYTRATGMWQDRKYNILVAEIENEGSTYTFSADIPLNTTVAFINIKNEDGLTFSSDYIEL